MTKAPPVPPENRSSKGVGDSKRAESERSRPETQKADPQQQGQQANTAQNTTHQGYQQDR
jgi:hypothetical protein